MQNRIKNAYTAYRIDNSTDYGNFISVSGAKFKGDILSFDMWLYIEDGGSEIISQSDGFNIGISQDKVLIKISGKNTLTVRSTVLGIPEKQWINLYFGYDGKAIRIFINGNTIGEVACSGKITNNNEIMIGRELTGYIRSLRFYSSVLSEEAFRKYFMASEYRSSEMKELSAFVDCTQKDITDLCGSGVSVKVNGGCSYMDLVDVYCPATGGFAYIDDAEEVNPGGFSTGQFSAYMKLYIRPSANGRQLLWINGEWNDADKIALAADKQGSKTRFVLISAAREYAFNAEISDYAWTDILISVMGNKLTAYINGEKQECSLANALKRNNEGSFKIGGCKKASDLTSSHYIHSAAVFDKALGDTDAQDFLENHPFIFEDGLSALVTFEGCKALELVNGLTVNAGENGLLPAQRTVDELPKEPYNFRLNYSQAAASEMKKWEAEQIVSSYKDFAVKMSGCSVTGSAAILEMLVKYLSNHAKILQKSAKLYTKPTIQAADAVSAINDTDLGAIKAIFTAFKLSDAASTSAAAAVVGSTATTLSAYKYAAIFAVGCAVAVSAASVIAAEVNELHKDKPDDDDDDEDISVKILSISYQHSPDNYDQSAVRCRNYQGTVNAPEWTHDKKSIAPALYIADQAKKVRIKFRFRIIDNSKKKASSYAVSFAANVYSGEKDLFDALTYKAEGLKADTEYEATAESGITASLKQTISYSQITLWWSCSVNGTEILLPNTVSEIYVIPQIPAAPVYLQKACENHLPAIEYLYIFAKMLSEAPEKNEIGSLGVTPEHLRWIANAIFYSPDFEYLAIPTPQYVVTTYDSEDGSRVLKFYEGKFQKDINKNKGKASKLQIECEVYAAIFGYYLSLARVQFHFVHIANPTDDDLHTNPVYTAGHAEEAPAQQEFAYHAVVGVNGVAGVPADAIYDTSLGLMEGTMVRPITGLQFQSPTGGALSDEVAEANYYRGKVIKHGTGAAANIMDIALVVDTKTLDPLLENNESQGEKRQ